MANVGNRYLNVICGRYLAHEVRSSGAYGIFESNNQGLVCQNKLSLKLMKPGT